MNSLVGSLRRLACCISHESPPLMAEPDVARVAVCSAPDTPQASTPTPLQPERKASPAAAANVVLSSFESLPVEIQIVILAQSPLDSLRALINSSPRLYYVYFHNRLSILNKSLQCTLGGIFQDAYAACRSDPWFAEVDASAGRFSFRDYQERLLTAPAGSASDELSLAVAHKMAYFHLRVVEPLTERYARWALGALSSSPEATPITRTEKARIQRAMYRLQIVCNISIRHPQTMLKVLDAFGPWQAEELLCVHEFAKERYTSVFIECAWELNQEENPKYHHIPLLGVREAQRVYCDGREPISQTSIAVQVYWLTYPEGINEQVLATMLSLGLINLRDSLEAKDKEELANIVELGIEDGYLVHQDDWIDGAVRSAGYPQHERHYEAYSEHDEAQDSRQKIQFEGDDLFSPPSAWVAFWDGRYSNLIGIYTPQALYRWGYVMWDAKRLEASGAMEYVELEWQSKYGVRGSPEEDDPREFYCAEYQANAGNDG